MTPIRDTVTPEFLDQLLSGFGCLAPLIFIVAYAIGICLFVPSSILTIIGAALFGSFWGFVYVWAGAIAGASGAFFIGRALGRDFVVSLIGNKLRKYDDAIEGKGFATVLYVRLINLPFTPMNFCFGLTKVHFRDYFFGTALGVTVGIFVLTFLVEQLRDVWFSGDWWNLLYGKVAFATALFFFSFFIPAMVKKIKFQVRIIRNKKLDRPDQLI